MSTVRTQVGDVIPAMVIEVTPTRVVAGAIASRDFMPVHHDRDYANQQGAPDIFMNIISTNGHLGRYLTDWAGPDSLVKRLSIRLGVLNLLADLQREEGLGVLYITHDLLSAQSLANHAIVLREGVVVEQGPASEVIDHPREEYTRQLLDAIPNPIESRSASAAQRVPSPAETSPAETSPAETESVA